MEDAVSRGTGSADIGDIEYSVFCEITVTSVGSVRESIESLYTVEGNVSHTVAAYNGIPVPCRQVDTVESAEGVGPKVAINNTVVFNCNVGLYTTCIHGNATMKHRSGTSRHMVPGNDVAADDSGRLGLIGYAVGCKRIGSAKTDADAVECTSGCQVVYTCIGFVADEVVGNDIAVSVQHLDTIGFHRRAAKVGKAIVGNGIVHVFAEIETVVQFRSEPMDWLMAIGYNIIADPNTVVCACSKRYDRRCCRIHQ